MTTPNPADPADPRAAAERIVALAEKAEPGPWTTGGFTYPNDPEKIRTSIWGPRREPHHQSGLWIADDVTVNESNFIAEARALAPILARAYLDSNPPLVWREYSINEEDEASFPIVMDDQHWARSDGNWKGVRAKEGYDLHNLAFRRDVGDRIEIACLASNGEPWPVRLAEVRE